ncbi:NADAR family protein [Enterovibrio coralii]|uniref:NADAR domain-containing protein n=1 Tax=Enterovibrio coralii TaxID=294935 RepID=A0A135I4T1_9GAMM|nr:NADAR family protein [Enterovibrio coralii]KXF80435.1 hypothetical protein ATN88_22025 [Enterovibrio coralii]
MTNRTIYFYEPDDAYGFLSNFFIAPLTIDDRVWLTSEHYYQAQKFPSFSLQERIRHARSPDEAFQLSRQFADEVDSKWMDVRCEVMRHVVEQKFTQHPALRTSLLATNDALLVEHSSVDAFWGDGAKGDGLNQLGLILMDVRLMLANNARHVS